GEYGGDGGLADVAAASLAVLADDVLEAPQSADPDEMEKLLARVGEVLAEVVLHVHAALSELGVEDLLHERAAAAAGRARLRLLLERAQRRCAGGHGVADAALGDAVARA